MKFLFAALAAVMIFTMVAARGADMTRVALFDAHVHYKEGAWGPYPTTAIKNLFDATGVKWALVSSSPDDGTLMLRDADPARVVPELRPYHGDIGSGNWIGHPDILAYLEERLNRNDYVGIGEFHVFGVRQDDPPFLAKVARLARDRNIILHVHSGAAPIRLLFELEPGLTILWAHAGMTEDADVVSAMMDGYANLYADTSFRETDIAPGGGRLSLPWREVLLKHPDRFLMGSDTYTNSQWDRYGEIIAENRAWLARLPADVALKIAYKNGLRLFNLSD